jgi:spore germination cell wall hydrolase CwlJ-like protein
VLREAVVAAPLIRYTPRGIEGFVFAVKIVLGALLAGALAVYASSRAEGDAPAVRGAPKPAAVAWDAWREPVRAPQPRTERPATEASAVAVAPADDIDVVDAHWMALTMWGEARSGGEEAMRAVGHVIDNRRRLGTHGRYATETVSEAWQFSCWNKGDPNYRAMLDIDRLRPGSRDEQMWLAAKRLAEDILAGRSVDPTGGALFYHTTAVAPRWSAGVAPTRLIGGHLFFASAR